MYILKPDIFYVWSNKTVALFLIVAFLSGVLPYLGIINIKVNNTVKKIPVGLIILTAILVCIKGFSNVGRDVVDGYYIGFQSASSLSSFSDQSVELGYRILAVVVHNIWNNYTFFLVVVAILTVIPVVYFVWKYRNYLSIGLALFLYTTIYYFQGLSLLRIFLAASIGLCAMDRLISHKNKSAFIFIVIAVLFHTSMLVLFIPYGIFVFNKISRGSYTVLLFAVFAFLLLYGNKIISSFSGRYSVYKDTFSNGLGFQQLLYYLPILILIYFGHKFSKEKILMYENDVYRLGLSLVIAGFFIGEVGYIVSIFGRAQVAFIAVIFIISYYTKEVFNIDKKWGIFTKSLVVCYGIFWLYVYLLQYYNVDDIMPYSTVWGWIF